MGPPSPPFGTASFHSNRHLRKRHLGPAWCPKCDKNRALKSLKSRGESDLLAAEADRVIRGALKMLSVLDFTHSVTCLRSWIVLLPRLNEAVISELKRRAQGYI